MTTRRKKIETMKVSFSERGVSFAEILNSVLDQNFNEGNGKLISLHKTSETEEYFQGYVNTTKQTGIPPKHSPVSNTFESLPINEGDGEGLGYSNVFIYNKQYGVLMYEFNKNGCYLTSLRRYLVGLFNVGRDIAVDILFAPLLKLEAYERMLNIDIYKSLEVKIANPSTGIRDFLDVNDAITSAINTCRELHTDTVDLKFDIKGKPIEGMPNQAISNLIRRVQRLATNYEERIVEKFSICGYYHDIEDDTTHKEVIDFLLDRYMKTFSIDEPNVLSDPQIREKSNSLFEVYLTCRDDFRLLAPIES
jgi:hypothetical protein